MNILKLNTGLYEIKTHPTMGRGVYALVDLEANTEIMSCEIIQLSQADTMVVNVTALKHYTFKLNDTQDCLVLGDGEMFNHDDQPNTRYDLEYRGDRLMMVFRTIEYVNQGEQLFTHYGQDTDDHPHDFVKTKCNIK